MAYREWQFTYRLLYDSLLSVFVILSAKQLPWILILVSRNPSSLYVYRIDTAYTMKKVMDRHHDQVHHSNWYIFSWAVNILDQWFLEQTVFPIMGAVTLCFLQDHQKGSSASEWNSLFSVPIRTRLLPSNVNSNQFDSLFLRRLKPGYFYSTDRNFIWLSRSHSKICHREQSV